MSDDDQQRVGRLNQHRLKLFGLRDIFTTFFFLRSGS